MMDPADMRKKTIWIDLDNSPHVPLFLPIIRHYREQGVEVILTARDHSQTLELLQLAGLSGGIKVIGRHYGKSKLNKIRGLFIRAKQLVSHIKMVRRQGSRIDIAVSHGSRSMVLAAKWLKIPIITMYDYEFNETGIFNRFSDLVLVPEKIPDNVLDDMGLAANKRLKYPGIKEEMYVRNFRPTGDFLKNFFETHSIPEQTNKILVVLRPPATTANYHSKQSEVLLKAILLRLTDLTGIFTAIVPRTREQASEIRALITTMGASSENYLILEKVVDGLDLAFSSDLLISGGGTMNREAVLLGVPVYSSFAGKQGALDAQMEKEGMITFIRDQEDIVKIVLEKRKRDETTYSNALTDRVERFVIEHIDRYL